MKKDLSVLFDWDAVVRNPYSGFYTFGASFVKEISDLALPIHMTLFFQRRYSQRTNAFLKGLTIRQRSRLRLKSSWIKFRWLENIWEVFDWPSMESIAGRYQIYHCFHHLMPRKFQGAKILTVHDLRRYRLPHLYPRSKLHLFERAVQRADHFICVSEATKRDLCSIFDINESRVDVVYLASSINLMAEIFKDTSQYIRKELGRRGIPLAQYLLVFSSKDRRKNVTTIARAFDIARKSMNKDILLLIIGSMNPIDMEEISKMERVFWLGKVEEVYPWLCQAQGLIFASLYEGFGIPIVEAFMTRTPVITSNCSSMPEVAGDAAILVEPGKIDEIARAIEAVCTNRRLRNELVAKGERRAKIFSWRKSAQKIYEIYKNILS